MSYLVLILIVLILVSGAATNGGYHRTGGVYQPTKPPKNPVPPSEREDEE